MIFHYLKELKPHLSLIGFLSLGCWIAVLVVVDMVTGSLEGHGPDPTIPVPPIEVSSPAAERTEPQAPLAHVQSSEENPPIQMPKNDCLDVEGSTICLE